MIRQQHIDLKQGHWTEKLVLKYVTYKNFQSFSALRLSSTILQILKAPTLPIPKKSAPKLPEFQVSAYMSPTCWLIDSTMILFKEA